MLSGRHSATSDARAASLAVPGASLHICEVGSADSPPVVIVHGGPGEAHDVLRPHLDALSTIRRVVYYDQRGGGRSMLAPGTPPGGFREHVADLDHLRVHLGGRLELIGFSWGALLALLYALEHRDRVARMVLVSPPRPRGLDPKKRERLAHAAERPSARAVLARLTAEAANGDLESARRAAFAARVVPCLFDPTAVFELTPVDVNQAAKEAAESSLRGRDLEAALRSLRGLPCLIIRGRDDPICEDGELGELLGAPETTLANCGHAPFVEAKERFLDAVVTFFAAATARD